MQETPTEPLEYTGEIYDKVTLDKKLRSYQDLHGFIPYQKVTGIMEDKQGKSFYCHEAFISDVSGRYFVIALEDGYKTLRVPEGRSITVILDPQED